MALPTLIVITVTSMGRIYHRVFVMTNDEGRLHLLGFSSVIVLYWISLSENDDWIFAEMADCNRFWISNFFVQSCRENIDIILVLIQFKIKAWEFFKSKTWNFELEVLLGLYCYTISLLYLFMFIIPCLRCCLNRFIIYSYQKAFELS